MEITNIDFSALLNMVDTFYSNAWNRLIITLAIVGVAWPIILKIYSDYHVKVKEEKLEKRLSEEIQNLNKKNLELINKKLDANIEGVDKFISKKLENIDIKLSASRGLLWHVQGNLDYEKEEYDTALNYFFLAFENYFNGKDELNLQRILNCIKNCYKMVKDLSYLEKVENQHLDLIKKLNEINENLRYRDVITGIEEEFDSAKKRLKKSKK
jgi:hypothetical protein